MTQGKTADPTLDTKYLLSISSGIQSWYSLNTARNKLHPSVDSLQLPLLGIRKHTRGWGLQPKRGMSSGLLYYIGSWVVPKRSKDQVSAITWRTQQLKRRSELKTHLVGLGEMNSELSPKLTKIICGLTLFLWFLWLNYQWENKEVGAGEGGYYTQTWNWT